MNAPSDKTRKHETDLAAIWLRFLERIAAVNQTISKLSPDKQTKK